MRDRNGLKKGLMMKEIRIHGRGGHGSVVAAELLARAAFKSGLYSQSFPDFGGERRGAPVQAFCRVDNSEIQLRCKIISPDYLIVMDASLMNIIDVFSGLKKGGTVLINSQKNPDELGITSGEFNIYTFPATEIAIEILGRPVMNTAMIGSFAALTRIFTLDSLRQAIEFKFKGKDALNNIAAMEKAYKMAETQFVEGAS